MKQDKLYLNMGFQHNFNVRWQRVRAFTYRPILTILTSLRIKPDHVTYLRLILVIIFALSFPLYPLPATYLILFAFFLDSVDGALARYQNSESDKGKFFDIIVDFACYAFLVSQFLNFAVPVLLVVHNIWLVGMAWLLAVILKEEGRISDWIIKPYPQELSLVLIPIIAFFAKQMLNFDFILVALYFSTIYAGVVSLIYLHFILKRWGRI